MYLTRCTGKGRGKPAQISAGKALLGILGLSAFAESVVFTTFTPNGKGDAAHFAPGLSSCLPLPYADLFNSACSGCGVRRGDRGVGGLGGSERGGKEGGGLVGKGTEYGGNHMGEDGGP